MSVWFGWIGDKNNETYNINASKANINLNTQNIFNGSITSTFKNSNFISNVDMPVATFRDTSVFTINPFDKKNAPDDILPGIRPGSFGEEEECENFQAELVEKLNDKEFQAAARQRYKILAGIVELNPKSDFEMLEKIKDKDAGYIMSKGESAAYFRSLPELTGPKEEQDDDSILQCDSMVVNPTVRSGKTIKVLTQELQYDLEREQDVKGREDLIMRCARYIRLERMSETLNDLT